MTDPTRLLSSSIDEDVQRWLKAGVDWRPNAGEQERIWQNIASEIGNVAAGVAIVEAANEVTQATAGAAKSATLAMAETANALSVGAGGAKLALVVVALKAVGLGLGIGAVFLVGGNAVTTHLRQPAAVIATTPSPTLARRVESNPASNAPYSANGSAPSPEQDSVLAQPEVGADLATAPTRIFIAATPTEMAKSPAPSAAPQRLLAPLGSAPTVRANSSAPSTPTVRVNSSAPSTPTLPASSSAPLAPAAASQSPAPSASHDSIRQETRLVSMARTALRQRRADSALELLREADQRYPSGQLGEERAVLRIEAMVQSGRSSEAFQLAERFLARYPSSLNANHVRVLIRGAHQHEQ